MGNFSVSALCDVCREVHTMHNMAVDSVDYTRVYTICEDVSARVWLLYTQTVVNIWVCVWDYVCARVDQASSADILQIVVRGLKAVRIQTSFVYIEYVQNYYREGKGVI